MIFPAHAPLPDEPVPPAATPPPSEATPHGVAGFLRTVPDPAPVRREVHGPVGLLLWQALEDALDWALAPAAERLALFTPGLAAQRRARIAHVAPEPEIAEPLEMLLAVTADAAGTPPLLVAHACLRLARHLARTGAGSSALSFARAAALAAPDHPRPALEVGRLLGPAREEEARVWLRHALTLAEASPVPAAAGEPDASQLLAHVHAELAVVTFRRGDGRGALGHLLKAARAARRTGAHARRG